MRPRTKKHKPERMCIGCRKKQAKSELMRFVCTDEGRVRPDIQQRLSGRGAYLCINTECLPMAIRNNSFKRAFRRKTDCSELEYLTGTCSQTDI
ncbi:MAG: YlxR family protein [Desulfobacteria bacterium]